MMGRMFSKAAVAAALLFSVNGAWAAIGWGNTQWPDSANIHNGDTVYGQVYKAGVTDSAGQGAGIIAQLGYGTSTTASSWTNWTTATYNTDPSAGNDEYMAALAISPPASSTTYYYGYRYSDDGGQTWDYRATTGNNGADLGSTPYSITLGSGSSGGGSNGVIPVASGVPTMGEWAMLIMASILAGLGLRSLQRK